MSDREEFRFRFDKHGGRVEGLSSARYRRGDGPWEEVISMGMPGVEPSHLEGCGYANGQDDDCQGGCI